MTTTASSWPGTNPAALGAAGLVLVGTLAVAYGLSVSRDDGSRLALQTLAGLAFGTVIQRSRWCFACNLRDLLAPRDGRRDSSGVIGLLVALIIGLVGSVVVLSAWIPDPSRGHLPPIAHIGPIGWHLALGGGVFGLGMAISGSCISAHLYRLGEGDLSTLMALLGSLGGFVLAALAWNSLYLAWIVSAPVVWLPAGLGWGGALVLQLGLLLVGVALLLRWYRPPSPADDAGPWSRLFYYRWPAWAGGLGIGFIATLCLLRGDALGVTAALAATARHAADGLGLLPIRLEGLDGLRGCGTSSTAGFPIGNVLFIAGLVAGSAMAALAGGRFRLRAPGRGEALRSLFGGLLLGFGAMISLGCTIGVLLSGIGAAALSGWLFAAALLGGYSLGLQLPAWAGGRQR